MRGKRTGRLKCNSRDNFKIGIITKDLKTCELTLIFNVEDDMKKLIFLVDGSTLKGQN